MSKKNKKIKEARFAGMRKNDFNVEISKDFYVQKESNVVVCVLTVAMPLSNVVPGMMTETLCKRVLNGFPNVEFNYHPKKEAFIIVTKGKAVCFKEDTFDELTGRSVAYAKAYGKSLSTVARIAKIVSKEQSKLAEFNNNLHDFMMIAAEREKEYINRI